jgi:hypothetical protein
MAKALGGITVEVDMSKVTAPSDLKIDMDEMFKRWGNKVSKHVRDRVKAGMQLDEDPIGNGWTLKRSGKLIRSIRYYPRYGSVQPDVRRRSDVSARARSNFGLFMILWNKYWKKAKTRLDVFDSWKRPEMLARYLQETIDALLLENKIRLEEKKGPQGKASDALRLGSR